MQSCLKNDLPKVLARYEARTGHALEKVKTVLFDMDGVLYDSMPGHCKAWQKMCEENGIESRPEEFLMFEGRTGASTIDIFFRRQFGRPATEEDIKRLYGRKSELFKALGKAPLMPGAKDAVSTVLRAGARPVLVTGSGQLSLLEILNSDYDGAFPPDRRVTALDVERGKPDPEPYLKGLVKGEAEKWQAVAIDNAPLGVESASRAGVFTIGVRTGPLPVGALLESGADIEIKSMAECAFLLAELL